MTKTIFITGASTGLGRATALLFAGKGWKVIATMRDPSKETELKATPNVTVMALDVTDAAQIAETAKAALALGPVDVVFNNAGYGLSGAFEGATDEQLQRQLNTNLLGVMRVTQAFLPALRERGEGMIVTTTSIGGLVTFPFNSVYHATKWGLEGWSESLAYELEPFGIKVKTVAPGGIATDFASRSLVVTPHPAYLDAMMKVTSVFRDPARRVNSSTAEQVAEDVWAAVNDPADQVTYVSGNDAKAYFAMRLKDGIAAFRKTVRSSFLGT
jgi:NAD(P)-dependent dehydrogenase (short-subunit alcohol dehydrogenase family)